jgi:hypothetical protein
MIAMDDHNFVAVVRRPNGLVERTETCHRCLIKRIDGVLYRDTGELFDPSNPDLKADDVPCVPYWERPPMHQVGRNCPACIEWPFEHQGCQGGGFYHSTQEADGAVTFRCDVCGDSMRRGGPPPPS